MDETPFRAWLDAQPPGAIERLSGETGIHIRTLYRYASGERVPPLRIARTLSERTGLDVSAFDVPARPPAPRGRRRIAAREARA